MSRAEPVRGQAVEKEDAELVHLWREGDRSAFDTLVERHQRGIYRLCAAYAAAHEEAADLAQEVFIRAYRGLHGFQGEAAFSTWLFRIAVNVCLNHRAARRPVTIPLADLDPIDGNEDAPDARLFRAERANAVRAAIARLPRRQRATLILRVYHDLPHAQIAAILGNSVGSAKGNFFHALANLRKLLEGRP